MYKLEEYLFHNVKIVDIYGNTHRGYVDMFSSAEDSGDDEDSIGFGETEHSKVGKGLFQSEIKSIEITD